MHRSNQAFTGRFRLRMNRLLLFMAALCLTACPGRIDDPERFSQTPPDNFLCTSGVDPVTTIIASSKCANAGCHAAGTTAQVDLVSPGVRGRLVGQASRASSCNGEVFIPTDATEGLLLDKLKNPTPRCGSRMPIGTPLTDAELLCVTEWVTHLKEAN